MFLYFLMLKLVCFFALFHLMGRICITICCSLGLPGALKELVHSHSWAHVVIFSVYLSLVLASKLAQHGLSSISAIVCSSCTPSGFRATSDCKHAKGINMNSVLKHESSSNLLDFFFSLPRFGHRATSSARSKICFGSLINWILFRAPLTAKPT